MKNIHCPFCATVFLENCEYVDIGVGYQQCSGNECPNCRAIENGESSQEEMDEIELKYNWRRSYPLKEAQDAKQGG